MPIGNPQKSAVIPGSNLSELTFGANKPDIRYVTSLGTVLDGNRSLNQSGDDRGVTLSMMDRYVCEGSTCSPN